MPDDSPFAPGQHVRVTCSGHPRTGDVGVVVTVDWSDGRSGKPGEWWLRVRFGQPATWDDWRTKGVIEDAWDLKADEVAGAGV